MKKNCIVGVLLIMCLGIFAGCGPQKHGEFYTLVEACAHDLLNSEDLRNIAYFQNDRYLKNEIIEEYEPKPKDPETLSAEDERLIKKSWAYEIKNNDSEVVEDSISIEFYCGTYKDCVAVMISDAYHLYEMASREVMICGIEIFYSYGNEILIWKRSTK